MFLTWNYLIPLAVFLAITLGVWVILSLVADRPVTAEDRLRRVLNPNTPELGSAALSRQDVLQAKVATAAKRLGKSLRPSNEAEMGKMRLMLLNAGFRGENAV